MSTAQPVAKKPGLPILQGILPIVGSRVPIDIIAGITLAALAIPEVMDYTKIAGMPVVTGLYTILIPTAPLAAALQERRREGHVAVSPGSRAHKEARQCRQLRKDGGEDGIIRTRAYERKASRLPSPT